MYILKKHPAPKIKNVSVYMEIYSSSRTAYRVIVSNDTMYGIEIESFRTGKKAVIHDFSEKLEDAVKFAESLIKKRTAPEQLYTTALSFLSSSI
ncbi:MAG: hypothetical protein ACI4K5_04195 [Ruminococcus sp.]|nr:hypothetical protein [Oscillospiraceae bacterium]MDY4414160.1 hypothetical protein [Ruminococcus sp.]